MAVKEASIAAATLGAIGGGVAAHQLGLGSSSNLNVGSDSVTEPVKEDTKWELKDLDLTCKKDFDNQLDKLFSITSTQPESTDLGEVWNKEQITLADACWSLDVSSANEKITGAKFVMSVIQSDKGVIVYSKLSDEPKSSLLRGVVYVSKDANNNKWIVNKGFEFQVEGETDWFTSAATGDLKVKFNDQDITTKKVYKWNGNATKAQDFFKLKFEKGSEAKETKNPMLLGQDFSEENLKITKLLESTHNGWKNASIDGSKIKAKITSPINFTDKGTTGAWQEV